MYIVKRETFLKMPEETIYSLYEPQCFDGLHIKMDSSDMRNDWFYECLIGNIKHSGSDDLFHNCVSMESGEKIGLEFDSEFRDGCFDEKQLFAIYEKEDVKQLIDRLSRCL